MINKCTLLWSSHINDIYDGKEMKMKKNGEPNKSKNGLKGQWKIIIGIIKNEDGVKGMMKTGMGVKWMEIGIEVK